VKLIIRFLKKPKTVIIFFLLAYIMAIFSMVFGDIIPMKIFVATIQLLLAPLSVYCLFLLILKET